MQAPVASCSRTPRPRSSCRRCASWPPATRSSPRPSPVEDYTRRPAPRKNDAGLDLLTERELEVLRLLATGKSNAELATQLFPGEGTIETHVSHVLSKLGLRDRVQAVVFAYESGLVEPGHG